MTEIIEQYTPPRSGPHQWAIRVAHQHSDEPFPSGAWERSQGPAPIGQPSRYHEDELPVTYRCTGCGARITLTFSKDQP